MNKNLGSLFLLLWVSLLFGEDFTYRFTVDKKTPYVKEAVVMTLDIEQPDSEKVLLFEFTPKPSESYVFHRLDTKEVDAYSGAKIHYLYLIYPLRSGKLEITFDLIKKETTKENLAYSISGDRDNVKGLSTIDTPVELPPLILQVKPLPEGTQLVGDFTLTYQVKKTEAEKYEPLPVSVNIKGMGYPPLLKQVFQVSKEVTEFFETPAVRSIKSQEGFINDVTYAMAFSSGENFTLDAVNVQAFDPLKKRAYTLNIPSQDFHVKQTELKGLVDETDAPKPLSEQNDFSWIGTFLTSLAAFVAGFLSANILKWQRKVNRAEPFSELADKVQETPNAKALLQLLLAADPKKYRVHIVALEKVLYSSSKRDLKKIKKEILEKL